MDDNKIIEMFFERNNNAIKELSDKYGAVCMRVAKNILNNAEDAKECINDMLLAVWNAIPPNRPTLLLSYVCRITRNLAIMKYHSITAQKRNTNLTVALNELVERMPTNVSPEEEIEAKEVSAAIDRFLGMLEKKDRIMFVRRYYLADRISDIAATYGKSSHYVTVHLSRIRKKLKDYLEKEGVYL